MAKFYVFHYTEKGRIPKGGTMEFEIEQREALKRHLNQFHLGDQAAELEELIIHGASENADPLSLIGHAYHVGWLVGQQAAVKAHNNEWHHGN